MDHHILAIVSITGIGLDVLAGHYLAYEMLGGQHGPLRLLTRVVTYSVVFGTGYGIGLGILFGMASGAATGITVALELQRTSRGQDHYSLAWEAMFSAIRAAAFGAALCPLVGLPFAVAFAVLVTAGQVLAYSRGMRPSLDYEAARRARITRRQLWGAVGRTVGYTAAAMTCSLLVSQVDHPWRFALRLGLVTGLVTAAGVTVNPYIEYYADHLPERRLGVFGICLLLCGFFLQSIQYLVAIFDIPLT